uniref:Transcription initiation factor TFIIA small subunit n=1 Tax=Tetraselmis sp. GSL018 TaxID=582737 RepID=A0A061QUF6_9CHLO|mmetsp:Transcript_33810/g.80245  ORF Transcript_33810/g.80245 Transcript_33810/m.80245 type:complete len:135 (-) Transcript_33810:85-489(-)
MSYEHYRESKLGDALVEALSELVDQNKISSDLALRVLVEFDKSVCDALTTRSSTKVTLKGNLNSYRFCDNQWQFYLRDVSFKTNQAGGSTSNAPEVTAQKMAMLCMADNLLNKDIAGTGKSKAAKKKRKKVEDE